MIITITNENKQTIVIKEKQTPVSIENIKSVVNYILDNIFKPDGIDLIIAAKNGELEKAKEIIHNRFENQVGEPDTPCGSPCSLDGVNLEFEKATEDMHDCPTNHVDESRATTPYGPPCSPEDNSVNSGEKSSGDVPKYNLEELFTAINSIDMDKIRKILNSGVDPNILEAISASLNQI